MSEVKPMLSPARLNAAPAFIAFFMLAIASVSFVENRLFFTITDALGIVLPVGTIYVDLAILPAMLALASLRAWKGQTLKAIMYLSLALYLPSVLGVSRLDPLQVTGFSLNFSIFSGSLPAAVIAVFGVLLACGGLLLRSFSRADLARKNFLERGADKYEVENVLYRSNLLGAKIIAASGAAVLLFIVGVPVLELALSWVLQSAKFLYVLAGLGAAMMLAVIILHYSKSAKR
jgi:hypothetical protein